MVLHRSLGARKTTTVSPSYFRLNASTSSTLCGPTYYLAVGQSPVSAVLWDAVRNVERGCFT